MQWRIGIERWEAAMKTRGHCVNVIAASVIMMLGASVAPTLADQWPQRPVRLIIPASAGSATDFTARVFADGLAVRWKQPVVVEHRPGADGLIGTTAFVGARDDHTLMLSFAAPISLLPVIHASLPYDPARDLVPIAAASDTFVALSAHASLKLGSLKDFVSFARSRPGQLNYYAPASALPYLMAGFLKAQHLDLVQVSYREQNLGVQDHAQGRIHVMISVTTSLVPLVQSGHIKLLAVTNSKRSPMMPEVPTATESGFPELAFEGLLGFIGPRGMSAELIERISADVRAVASEPAVAARLGAVGQVARGTTPAEFAEMIEVQRAKIATIVQETGMRASR
jgi:tripartite-type tricarboxylate transporter receptor subunit TctC